MARSFYRLEVYRHLFRNRDDYDYGDKFERPKPSSDFQEEEQWEVSYKHYAVWELEQLATAGEYLFRKTATRTFSSEFLIVYLYRRWSWTDPLFKLLTGKPIVECSKCDGSVMSLFEMSFPLARRYDSTGANIIHLVVPTCCRGSR